MKIYGLGDTHRNMNYVRLVLNLKKDCYVFHVGDFEVGYLKEDKQIKMLEEFNEWLVKRNIIMYVIRGNHDDPYYFKGNHFYSNLQFLPDYTIIEVEDRKVLCVGGAISIDRVAAKWQADINERAGAPREHWDDEGFVLREDVLNNVRGVDMVVTHTAPTYCWPFLKGNFPKFMRDFAKDDKTLLDDIKKERGDMDRMFEILNKNNYVRDHIYGHFHKYYITDNLHTQHVVLDKCDLFEI